MRKLKYAHSFEVFRELPESVHLLKQLAYNLRWTWNHETQALFQDVDVDLWHECEHNPVELLNKVSRERLEALADDDVFTARMKHCYEDLQQYLTTKTWFEGAFPDEVGKSSVAYFCFEFGIHECLPIYSGGLGILAGDHLKAASDLGIPLTAVGLLYSRGYFRQKLSHDGWQQENYPEYDFYRMPLVIVRDSEGLPVRIQVEFPDRVVTCQIWKAQVGRIELYLLDSNVLENSAADQTITDSLYGGDEEMRIRQETILGIGGFRALQKLGIQPTVCHMNEGHAAFLSLERLRTFMEDRGCDLRIARKCVVSGNVFTTHTPVPAGFDIFESPLLQKYTSEAIGKLGLPFEQFQRLGRIHKDQVTEPLNMAVLAMEMSNYVNGVSKLHAAVTREMFQERWKDYPLEDVPIDSVTNGIHTLSFMSTRMVRLFEKYVGPDWEKEAWKKETWEKVNNIPDRVLWEARENARGDFVRYCRRHLRQRMHTLGDSSFENSSLNDVLDPRILTIGFARRFATYKRGYLLFQDKERLKQMLFHKERPVQFVFAGKAHPKDEGGKKIIQDICRFIQSEVGNSRMLFLEDYDISVARQLVQGVDVWLNNPRRPLEASGTSGMKVVPNGGLNCSILDGWWAEGFAKGRGWAIGDQNSNPDEPYQDWLDSRALYHLIEHEIAPTFYHRTDNGIPSVWVEMIKKSMSELAPVFSTSRMLREYTSRFYVPASKTYQRLTSGKLERAKAALEWRDRVTQQWRNVKIVEVTDTAGNARELGSGFDLQARVELGDLAPDDVSVQVITGRVTANRELSDLEVHDFEHVRTEGGCHIFQGHAHCIHAGNRGYVVRVVPSHEDVRVPSETDLVTWETPA